MGNVERIEILGGPNSIIYGEAFEGGTINYITRKPVGIKRTNTTFTVGSYDYYKLGVENTGPLLRRRQHQVDYRVDAGYENAGNWMPFMGMENTFSSPQ